MPAAAQNARRYFIQIAQRLKEQHAQNPHACALNDRSIRRKKPRERISEQDNRKKRNRTAKQRQAQTQPQNAPTSPEFPGGVVLTGKGRRRLTERGNDVIGNVFKIHGYRASGNCFCAEAVDRRLHKNVCKAEHRTLHSRRNAGFQNAPHAIARAPLIEDSKAKHCILCQTTQHQKRREHGGKIRRNRNACNAHAKPCREQQVEPHICKPGKQQRQKRIPAVAPRPQTGSAEVIQQQKRISQHINPQIKRRRVKDFLRCPDQPQQGRRSNLPQKQSDYADAHGKPHCRLHCSGQLFRFVSPDVLCNQNICPDGQPRRHRDNQGNDLRVRSDCRKRIRAAKMTRDGSVCRVEQLLDHAAQGNRQRKQQQLSGKAAMQHVHI